MELGKPEAETSSNKASNHKMEEIVSTKELRHDFHGMASGNFGKQTEVRVVRENSPLSIITSKKASSDEYRINPLTFTFVPSVGRLPAHSQVAETPKSILKVSKEPKPSNIASKYWTLESGSFREIGRDLNYPCKKDIFTQEKEAALDTFVDMEDNDIFQAEYVFVMDSDEEEDKSIPRSINEKSYSMSKQCQPMPSAVSLTLMELRSITTPVGTVNISAPRFSISSQEELSTLSSTTHLISSTLPAINVVSPSNQRVDNVIQPPNQAFSADDDSRLFRSATGSPIINSKTWAMAPDYSSSSSVMQHVSAHHSPVLSSSSESQIAKPSHKQISKTLPQSLSPERPFRTDALSPLPTHIETHHLCPHPKPLHSPMFGSSSTICSTEELFSPMSPHRTLSKSGKSTSLPSRLSFLTAILKSGQTTKQRSGTPTPYISSMSAKPLGSPAYTNCQRSTRTKTLSTNWATLKQGDLKPTNSDHYYKQTKTLPSSLEFSVWNQPLQASSHSPPQQHKTLNPYLISPKPCSREKVMSPVVPQRLLSPPRSSSTSNAQSPSPVNLKPPIKKELKQPLKNCTEPGKLRRDRTPSPTVSMYTSHSITIPSNQRVIISPDSEKHLNENYFSPRYASSKVVTTPLPTLKLSVASSTHAHSSSEFPSPRSQSTPSLLMTQNAHFYPPHPKSLSPSPNLRNYSRSPNCEQMASGVSTSRMSPVPLLSSPYSTLSRSCELSSAQSLSLSQSPDNENKTPKATDELAQSPHDAEDIFDTYSEVCSPAQLRQQTEEVCAAIDEVLQDPLHHETAPPSPKFLIHSDDKQKIPSLGETFILDNEHIAVSRATFLPQQTSDEPLASVFHQPCMSPATSSGQRMTSSLPRTAGRETKYAAPSSPITIPTYIQKTKPGVIRPLLVKPTILLKREESYCINPYQ
ncbi:muscular LMNA-interacting protein isoform X3 [Lissotriton helveticus]